MSGGTVCQCKPRDRAHWRVVQWRCNHSAFNGYHYTSSRYSSVTCLRCRRNWRTKADYPDGLEHYSEAEPRPAPAE